MRRFSSVFFIILLGAIVAAGCKRTPAAESVERWQVIAEPVITTNVLLTGFISDTEGRLVGDDGLTQYTHDGGATWESADAQSMGLYGMEIVDSQVAWACGNGSAVRFTADGGLTWTEAASFGGMAPGNCRLLSFLDAGTGWAATATSLGTTVDGAATWTEAALPDGTGTLAAISLAAPGVGYILDVTGNVYATADNGDTWTGAGALPLGDIAIAAYNYPVAAMRFQPDGHGMVVVSTLSGGSPQVFAFLTSDGGATWTRELVPAPYGLPFISRDGKYLTLMYLITMPHKATVLKFNGE
jgi:photosystem II stability/assembly factor-like uncharacterized protein